MMLGRWRSFCNPAIAVMRVCADTDKGNGTPVTADSRFDGTFRRCFDDPAAAALFRLGDARIRDDASPQPRCRPDLAGSNGECANWIHERITLPSPEAQNTLETITELLSWFFAAMVGAVLLA